MDSVVVVRSHRHFDADVVLHHDVLVPACVLAAPRASTTKQEVTVPVLVELDEAGASSIGGMEQTQFASMLAHVLHGGRQPTT